MKTSLSAKASKLFSDLRFNNSTSAFVWVGVIIFVMSLILTYMGTYIANSSRDFEEISWKYVMVNNIDSPVEDNEWITYNHDGTLDAYSNKKYFHLTKTFVHSNEDQVLYFETDNAPVLVRMDGKDIYNLSFDSAEYVGNKYNAIAIPASVRDTVIDIYFDAPMSTSFFSHTETVQTHNGEIEGEETVSHEINTGIKINTAFYIGLALLIVTIGIFIVSVIFAAKIKKSIGIMRIVLVDLSVAVSVLLYGTSCSTYYLNSSIFYDVWVVSVLLIFAAIAFNILRVSKASAFNVILLLAYIIVSLGFVAPVPLLIKKFILLGATLVGLFMYVVLIASQSKSMRNRIQYSAAMITVATFAMLLLAACAIIIGFDIPFNIMYIVIFMFIVVTCVIMFCDFGRYVVTYRLNESASVTADIYETWMENEDDFIESVVGSKTIEEFIEKTVKGMSFLIEQAKRRIYRDTQGNEIRANVALFLGGKFHNIYKYNIDEECNFISTLKYYDNTGSETLISDYHFDFILKYNEAPAIFFHFENITADLVEFIENLLNLNVVILNTVLHTLMTENDDGLFRRNSFIALAEYIERKNGSEDTHLSNVYAITKLLATKLGFEEAKAEDAARAAMLHDIGKLAIPESLLTKKDTLNGKQRKIIDLHSKYGYVMLSKLNDPFMKIAAQIALGHHCKAGNEYPEEIEEEYIKYVKIVTVADVYDALISERSYKSAWSPERAFSYINSLMGETFDNEVVAAMNEVKQQIIAVKHVDNY